jgi:hypothetical protein
MRALTTIHRGVTFRSRLEADWAATLDSLDIAWDYEPEGFELSDGTYYSPDFYLPTAKAWLEVKGDHMQRVSKVEQFAADMWAEWEHGVGVGHPPLVILGLTPHKISSKEHPRMIGIKGPRSRHSVFICRCACRRYRISAFEWDDACPYCPDGRFANDRTFCAPFARVPRPVGRGGR